MALYYTKAWMPTQILEIQVRFTQGLRSNFIKIFEKPCNRNQCWSRVHKLRVRVRNFKEYGVRVLGARVEYEYPKPEYKYPNPF